MKKLILLIIFFGLLNSQTTKQNDITKLVEFTKDQLLNNPPTLISSILNNYSTLLILLFALAVFILAIGYFGASFFDLTETKVFIKTEIGQLILTAIFAGSLFGIIIFVDRLIISSADFLVSPCGENYVYAQNIPIPIQYANCYLDSLIKLADKALEENIKESIEAGRETYKQVGYQVSVSPLSGYYSFRPAAFKRLDVEIKTAESHFLSSFLISLISQKAFLNYIAPVFGIFLLFIGLLFRILFFTRKLGGLLIAAGFGLLLIWPLTYMISWFTFRAGIFGSQNLGEESAFCPKECQIPVPVAYNFLANPKGEYKPETMLTLEEVAAILKEKPENKNQFEFLIEKGIQPCFVTDSDKTKKFGIISVNDSENCDESCREIPLNLQVCKEQEKHCDALPLACKIIRSMGLENYTSYYQKNSQYCSNKSVCSNCPDSCKYQLREIRYSSDPSFIPKDPTGVGIIPRTDLKNTINCSSKCEKCPPVCRYYSKKNDGTFFFLNKDSAECKNCDDCFNYKEPSTQLPICMTYVPLISVGNCQQLCGIPYSIRNAPNNNICPIDCRIYFDSTTDKYKDPVFSSFCEKNGEFFEACNRCPIECKINASEVINQIAKQQNPSCSLPPTFSNGQMDNSINKNCARCDPSCRFSNPSSIASAQIKSSSGVDINNIESYIPIFSEFYAKTFVQQNCSYSSSPYVECPTERNGNIYTDCNWKEGSDSSKTLPTYSPAKIIYPTTGDNPFCPDFIAKLQNFVLLSSDENNHIIVKANQYLSHLCTLDKDSEKFCSSPYCPSSCYYNSWPNFAALENISNITSKINFALSNCNFNETQKGCYYYNYLNMVVLNYSGQYYLPKSAVQSCFPSISSISSDLSNFACYPILKIPSASDFSYCGNYIDYSNPNRSMIKGSACPYECRYDELKKQKNPQICGDFTLSFTSSNPSHNCEPFCNGLIRSSDLSYCNSEAYSCTQQQAQTYWVRINSIPINKSHSNRLCNQSVVLYNSSITYKKGDLDRNNQPYAKDWWEDSCTYIENGETKYINFTLVSGYSPYLCSAGHKYIGLDELISSSGYSQYRECGEIDTNKNPNYIFCGNYSINVGGTKAVIKALDDLCYASYNARAMPGLAYHSIGGNGDFSTKVNGQIKQNIQYFDNCQQCPVVFRIKNLQDAYLLGIPGILTNLLNCQKCNIKINPPYSSSCEFKYEKAIGCPLRCRIATLDGSLPYGCDPDIDDQKEKSYVNPEVGYACDDYHALSCRINLREDLCDGCSEFCESDCQSLPYIRRDCSSCNPAASFGANSLLDATTSQAGLVTQPGWIRIGLLLIPSIILPSFSIVILVSFIKGLSQFLGGDIEIPGLYKLI
ncbi:MAG: hypothetical protein ACK4J0_00235 [Candidatus Anstonellaceae archaeon]